jgi:hypothetical protein
MRLKSSMAEIVGHLSFQPFEDGLKMHADAWESQVPVSAVRTLDRISLLGQCNSEAVGKSYVRKGARS